MRETKHELRFGGTGIRETKHELRYGGQALERSNMSSGMGDRH